LATKKELFKGGALRFLRRNTEKLKYGSVLAGGKQKEKQIMFDESNLLQCRAQGSLRWSVSWEKGKSRLQLRLKRKQPRSPKE